MSTSSKKPHSSPITLTPEQQTAAAVLREELTEALGDDITILAQLLATKTDATFFGDTEFQVRDIVLAIGAKSNEVAIESKKKRTHLRARRDFARVVKDRRKTSECRAEPSLPSLAM